MDSPALFTPRQRILWPLIYQKWPYP